MAFSLFGLSTLVTFLLIAAGVYFIGPKYLGKKFALYGAVGLVAFGLISGGTISLAGLSAGGGTSDMDGTAGAVSTGTPRQLDSLDIMTTEMYSNSLANVDSGEIRIFDQDEDPKNPNAVALFESGGMSDGRETNTTVTNLKTNTPYRVIFDGEASPTFYSRDFGIIQLADSAAFAGADTVESQLQFKVLNIATLSDIFNEGAVDIRNGHAIANATVNNASQAPEIGCRGTGGGEGSCGADATMIYNQTPGDGSVYLDVTFEAAGSNEGSLKPVICFKDTSGSELEDNELSSSTMQLRTGTDLGIPSNVLPYITNEECISIKGNDVVDYGDGMSGAQVLKSGTSSTYRWTIAVTEANINAAADSFDMKFDDLGDFLGKDIGLRVGSAADDVTIQLE